VVVPSALVWQAPTLKALASFLEAGGAVLFLGEQPAAAQPLLAHKNARKLDAAPATQGYHFYSGNMIYRFDRNAAAGERAKLWLKGPLGTAFLVRVNGRDAAQINWAPWEADLSAALQQGANKIELVVLGSLQNTFGPLHNKNFLTGNDWWVGPDAFANPKAWMEPYFHAPYGFAGLEWVTAPMVK